ncbi:MAG: hypothetical protein LQ352_004166 [Teloschistes flavicans]|nr:MAG: hypothetical protein LQ352_004166 [Teloschistes flavicans]
MAFMAQTPKNPVVLAHGLLGFDELHLAGPRLPGVHYWRGIAEALRKNGVEVITTHVPASSSIEERAERLGRGIEEMARGKSSAFADYVFEQIGPTTLPRIYNTLKTLKVQTGAFSQLTRRYMQEEFNPTTPDREDVRNPIPLEKKAQAYARRYFSYGASVSPAIWSAFRRSHRIVSEQEGPNDGLVSVASSKWGEYKGTLVDVSHLDLINWTNRLRWLVWEMTGNKRKSGFPYNLLQWTIAWLTARG